ncbi:MAG: GNAT family N-acetyltransferase [Paracoccaceae bacterium]
MQIERIAELNLTPPLEAEIASLLLRSFGPEFAGRTYFQQRHHLRLIMRETGGIVGHAALMLRAVRLGGVLVDVAGLAEVATDPDHRGRGIAGALVQAAIGAAAASPARHLLLFGTAGLYAGAGFRRVHNPMTWISLTGARMGAVETAVAKYLMVRSVGDAVWDDTAPLDLMGHLF